MKRTTLWILGATMTSLVLVISLRAQEQQVSKAAPAKDAKQSAPAPDEGKVAFTFSDDAQMQQFAKLWKERQVVLTRMAVLQDYWSLEQSGLGNVNQELLAKFNLDVNKNYTLAADRKVLLEREAPSAPPTKLGEAPDQIPPASATP